MTDKSDRVLLRYEIDEAALNRAIARVNAARERIGLVRGEINQINQAAKPTGDALRKIFDDAEKSASKLSSRLDEINKKRLRGTLPSQAGSLDDLRESLSGGRERTGGVNFARADSLATTTGRALRGLGQEGIGEVLMKVGDAAQLGDNLNRAAEGTGKMASAAQGLLSVAGPAAIGIGLAVTAFALLNSEMEKGKDAVKGYIDEQRAESAARLQAAKELRTLTTEQARERASDLQNQIKENNDLLKLRAEQRDAVKKELDEATKNQGEGNDLRVAPLAATFKQLEEDTTKLTGESLKLKIEYIATKAVLEPLVALREKEAAAIKATRDARLDALQLEERSAIKTAALIRRGSASDIEEGLTEARTNLAIKQNSLVALITQLGPDDPAVAEARRGIAQLKADIKSLETALPFATLRDANAAGQLQTLSDTTQKLSEQEAELSTLRQRETQFIEKAAEAMNAFADETERLNEERGIAARREGQDFTIKRGRDQAEFTRRQAESDATYYKDRGKRVAALNRELADSDNEAQKARAKAVQDANDAQVRAAEDFARTVRGFTEQITDAGANLDAIGVRNAQRGLKDATDQYNLEKRRRDQDAKSRIDEIIENAKEQKDARLAAFAEELADADAQHAAERQKEQEEFTRRLQIEDQDRALRLQRQQEDQIRQDNARKAAFDRQVQNLRTQLLEPEEREKLGSYGRQRAALNDFLNGAVNDVNAAKSRVTTSAPSNANRGSDTVSNANRVSTVTASQANRTSATTSTRKLIGFAHGGRPPIGVPVMINEGRPEPVIFGSPAQVGGNAGYGGGGVNIGDIYLNGGLAPEQYKAMVRQGIAEAFTEAMN